MESRDGRKTEERISGNHAVVVKGKIIMFDIPKDVAEQFAKFYPEAEVVERKSSGGQSG